MDSLIGTEVHGPLDRKVPRQTMLTLYDKMIAMSIWMIRHRRVILMTSNLCLAAALFCMLGYTMSAEVIRGQEEGSAYSNPENSVRIAALRERMRSIEDEEQRQWSSIIALQTDMATNKADIASIREGQETNTHLLYAVIAAVLIQIISAFLRDRKEFVERKEE